jgi:hypothetical protein
MRKILALLLFGILISGCAATRYRVETNGYLDVEKNTGGSFAGSSFYVAPNTDVENKIFDKEIKAKIEKLLVKKGYAIKPAENAQYFLTYSYAIDGGETKIGNTPVYNPGQTTYSSGTFTGNGGAVTYSGTTQTLGYTTYVPRSYTVYRRILKTNVIDSPADKSNVDREPVWMGETISIGGNNDLREVINYLLLSNFKYFGENTKKVMSDTISQNDKDVRELRGEAAPATGRSE